MLWVAGGPVVTAAVTAWVNTIVHAYVPRPVQLVLSSIFGAIIAGMTGSLEGVDPSVAAGIGGAAGLGAQAFAMLKPSTLLTSAPGAKAGT